MPSFKTIHRVAHRAEDMFALVADVEKYPEFAPLCEALRVMKREQDGDDEIVIARMTVAYKMFRESFTSRVRLNRGKMTIFVDYLDGPFKKMENRWTFTPVSGDGGCDVGFDLDYEFRSRTLQMLMGAVFDRAFRKFSAAFEARADVIYPPSRSPAGGMEKSLAGVTSPFPKALIGTE